MSLKGWLTFAMRDNERGILYETFIPVNEIHFEIVQIYVSKLLHCISLTQKGKVLIIASSECT